MNGAVSYRIYIYVGVTRSEYVLVQKLVECVPVEPIQWGNMSKHLRVFFTLYSAGIGPDESAAAS